MNSFTNSMQKTVLQASRRFNSATTTVAPKAPFVPDIYKNSFKKTYSNPGVYPLLAVLGAAGCFIVGMTTNRVMYRSKQAKFSQEAKNSVIQTWGTEKTEALVNRASKRPIAFNAQGFRSLRQEGLGVDHEEWKKGKEAYSQASKSA
jgi:hypothetical protein